MSHWRAVRLVAMREILERGRSRGYVLSLVFTLLLLLGGFVLPQLLLTDQATRLALVEPVPAGLETAVLAGAAAYDLDSRSPPSPTGLPRSPRSRKEPSTPPLPSLPTCRHRGS